MLRWWRLERPSRKGSAGFTLVEALAALAVLAAGLAAIGALSNTSLRGSLDAQRHLAQVSAVQRILAGLPARNALPFGRVTGVLDHYSWRVDSTVLDTTDAVRSAEWNSARHRIAGAFAFRLRNGDRHHPLAKAADAMSESKTDGFSLLEAIAAVALTATIILGLTTITGLWLPNWRRGFADLQRVDLVGLGLDRLLEDLSVAEYVTSWGDAPGPFFEGDPTSVTFVRSAIGPNSGPQLDVVRIAQSSDERGPALNPVAFQVLADCARPTGAALRLHRSGCFDFGRRFKLLSPMRDPSMCGRSVGRVRSGFRRLFG